ncbi:hypothetical protein CAPTEDRAFT_219590 [Capitella teleta]|uniref:DDRGK domain-containing protein 1 n=1 Tax=Capitella teleta TaxID=283909 RepID=R7ULJ6_CAPTE|nr:hypothetical protein CAPTEDRAFT_219590 [Capitella teleta]|eukprot:ELU04147.1 hypothetical protein CAPTEDRAFT_219590 [Capitella teleta]
MEPLVYIAGAVLTLFLLAIVTFITRSKQNTGANEEGGIEVQPRQRDPRAPPVGAAPRRRGARQRLAAAARRQEEEEDDREELFDQIEMPEGKIGAKKLAKLQSKAEKRAAREAELAEREDRKKREAELEAKRKKAEEKEEMEEKLREEDEKKRKEEEEAREYEEYLKLKEAFSVDEEGTHEAELNEDTESLLQEFINYIKNMKVIMLEDLAAHFKIRTQDAIDRVQTLLEEEKLSGVMDDRGKFIYITQEEYEAVSKFIKQRGRVSITELVESSNQLIDMNPDNLDTLHKLTGSEVEAAV